MTTWTAMFNYRRFLPDTFHADDTSPESVINLSIHHGARNSEAYRVETMTDQIDVYCGQRRIATYMPS